MWSKSSGSSKREDSRQIFWMWAGGAVLLVVLVTGTMVALRGGDHSTPPGSMPPVLPAAASNPAAPVPPAAALKSDEAFLTKAEPMARMFLEAARIEDLLPLVRNPDVAQSRMRRHYPEGKIKPPGMTAFNTQSEILRRGSNAACTVQTLNYDEKLLAFVETPHGLKIDWESWVGWADMPWEEFLTKKPAAAQVFRLMLCPVEYYNIAFANDTKWQSYRLISPDGKHAIYGYAERGSPLNAKLAQATDGTQSALTLALKFPDNPTAPDQVLIESHVADGWVLESESAASP